LRCLATLQALSGLRLNPRLWVSLLATSAAAGALVATLPSLVLQMALFGGAVVSVASAVLARTGRLLNPAWIIVGTLYLADPLASMARQYGIEVPTFGLMILAASPFVLMAALTRPHLLDRLVLLTPFLLLILLAVMSLLWSSTTSYGLETLNLWILTGFVPAVFIAVLDPASNRVSWPLVAGAAFIYAISLILFGADSPLYPGRYVLPVDTNPIWVARAVFLGALVVLLGPFPTPAKVVMASVMILAGLRTDSLGPLVGLVVGLCAGAVEKIRCAEPADRRRWTGWAGLGLGLGAALTGALLLFGAMDKLDPSAALSAGDFTSRASSLRDAADLYANAPVLGAGIGGFSAVGPLPYPHNLIGEIGSELGLVGILILVAWFALAVRGAARSPLLVGLVVATATFSLFSGNVASDSEFWIFTSLAVVMIPVGRARAAQRAAVAET
jgi:hypothetical protein